EKPVATELASKILAIEDIWGEVFKVSIEKISDIDWLVENQKSFKPFEVGDFFIYQDIYKGDIPNDKIAIKVQASKAFGTGSHATTMGCLQAIDELSGEFNNVIDVGTGTGILSVAINKHLKPNKIIATDVDKDACEVAFETFNENDVSSIDIIQADGLDNKCITNNGKYDLLVANILAKPLIEISKYTLPILTDNASIILSGINKTAKQSVLDCYTELGFVLSKQYEINDWYTLLMLRNK
ncbi:MAG: 50S ribosomal protein L11 methyltransferase, partial [Alphaproteobacteria bacterium]